MGRLGRITWTVKLISAVDQPGSKVITYKSYGEASLLQKECASLPYLEFTYQIHGFLTLTPLTAEAIMFKRQHRSQILCHLIRHGVYLLNLMASAVRGVNSMQLCKGNAAIFLKKIF